MLVVCLARQALAGLMPRAQQPAAIQGFLCYCQAAWKQLQEANLQQHGVSTLQRS